MISGSTYLLVFDFSHGVSDIDKIIFTFKGSSIVTKNYPGNVTFSNGKLIVPLYQEDTVLLDGYISIEAQINFSNKSVAKKRFNSIYLNKSLATEIVKGNIPNGDTELAHLDFDFDGDVVIARVDGLSPEKIKAAIEAYFEEHPLDYINEEECEEIVADYVTEHHDELKGDKGDKGNTGEKGEKGDPGEAGPQGIQGPKGDPGDKGADGAPGVNGNDGAPGADGLPGDSAYQIAVNHGYVGTEEQWLASLKGANGEAGAQGPEGPAGPEGPQGPKGDPGVATEEAIQSAVQTYISEHPDETKGEKGDKGDKGDQGEIGPQGPAGQNGADGAQGPEGPMGPQGEKGDTGPQGPQGEKGDKGDTGEQGPKGDKGDKGDPGEPATAAITCEDATDFPPVSGDVLSAAEDESF